MEPNQCVVASRELPGGREPRFTLEPYCKVQKATVNELAISLLAENEVDEPILDAIRDAFMFHGDTLGGAGRELDRVSFAPLAAGLVWSFVGVSRLRARFRISVGVVRVPVRDEDPVDRAGAAGIDRESFARDRSSTLDGSLGAAPGPEREDEARSGFCDSSKDARRVADSKMLAGSDRRVDSARVASFCAS
jgi:hypothetical protein